MKKIYQWLKLYKCEAYKGKEIYERKKVCESKFTNKMFTNEKK